MKSSDSTTKMKKTERGQTVVSSTGRDNSSHKVENALGGKMGGGIENLGHSLKGASAVQKD